MGKTSIEWTDASWNPIVGCTEISPGCANCYAARLAATRLKNTPRYKGLAFPGCSGEIASSQSDLKLKIIPRPRWTGEVRNVAELDPEVLQEPLHWKKPRRIFVCDMGDLFHEGVSGEEIAKVFLVMQRSPQHTFQVLTKRAARMRLFCTTKFVDIPLNLPLPNVWLGVSVENQHFADERIPLLLQTPAAVRWISAEPLLGPVNLQCVKENENFWRDVISGIRSVHPCLDWVVCGGESGANARPMDPAWARSLRDQCRGAGVPFFFKQWGEWSYLDSCPKAAAKVGKKKAGRLLDGREWNEFPKVAPYGGFFPPDELCRYCPPDSFKTDPVGAVGTKFGVADSLANDTGHGPFFGSPAPLLTEQDIVDRAAARARRAENRKTIYWSMIYGAMACGLMLAFYQPVHTWLRGYAEFLIGVFVGSSIEAVMWIWERVKRWR